MNEKFRGKSSWFLLIWRVIVAQGENHYHNQILNIESSKMSAWKSWMAQFWLKTDLSNWKLTRALQPWPNMLLAGSWSVKLCCTSQSDIYFVAFEILYLSVLFNLCKNILVFMLGPVNQSKMTIFRRNQEMIVFYFKRSEWKKRARFPFHIIQGSSANSYDGICQKVVRISQLVRISRTT